MPPAYIHYQGLSEAAQRVSTGMMEILPQTNSNNKIRQNEALFLQKQGTVMATAWNLKVHELCLTLRARAPPIDAGWPTGRDEYVGRPARFQAALPHGRHTGRT